MQKVRILPLLVALLVALPSGSASLQAQEGKGRVEGTVYDSTSGRFLPGARVVLWNTSHVAFSDSLGRFLLEGIPEGEYSVVFYHPRLAYLGVSAGPKAVRVAAGRTSAVELATPSMLTILKQQCTLESYDPRGALAAGIVTDAQTGIPFPRAEVRLNWVDPATGIVAERTDTTDSEGWYRFCSPPEGVPLDLRARFLDRSGSSLRVVLTPAESRRVDLPLGSDRPVLLEGVVLDLETGRPVTDAEVRLRGTNLLRITDRGGRFSFGELVPGRYVVEVSHLAYGTRADSLTLPGVGDVHVEIRVAQQPVELPEMVISVEPEVLGGLAPPGGHVIDREAIVRLRARARDVGDILRVQNISGLIVRRQGNDVCVGFMPAQARMSDRGPCVPMVVYIDNVRAPDPYIAVDIPVEQVERMVVYRPLEAGNLFGLGSGNGILLIFTKNTRRR